MPNDIEIETGRWYTQFTVYGNDKEHTYNADLCNIIRSVKKLNYDVESYEVDEEMYNILKQKGVSYYNGHPLTKRSIPELTRQERRMKRIEFIAKENV